jgi:hypothetical protein
MKKKLIFFLLLMFISTISFACPFCNTQSASEIRASLFGPDFLLYMVAILLPFIIFTIIILILLNRTKINKQIKT